MARTSPVPPPSGQEKETAKFGTYRTRPADPGGVGQAGVNNGDGLRFTKLTQLTWG